MIQANSLLEAIDYAKQGTQSMVKCPAHDDGSASLHVAPGSKQPVVMTCHANCTRDSILEAAGIDWQLFMAPRIENNLSKAAEGEWTPVTDKEGRTLYASHVYDYADEHGELLFQVLRIPKPTGGKDFRQRHPDETAKSGWKWNMNGVRRVIYCLPEVIKARDEGRVIFIVEGEKDADTIRALGETATTSPMGAGKWDESYSEMMRGANVVIISDADAPGRDHARAVRESLIEMGCVVEVMEPMNGCKDATDHFMRGGTFDTLIVTIPAEEDSKESFGMDILDAIKREIKPATFVIPGVLAQGDRLLLTGFEGHGKSTLCRQLGVQVAAGIHPWTGQDIEPQKVLVIDTENHPDQVLESWQHMIGLARRLGRPIERGMLILQEEWDSEINLNEPAGKRWLLERVNAHKPKLVVIGPLYNLSSKDLTDHAVVNEMKVAINEARGLHGTAFIMEHHAPHRSGADKERAVRPYGSSTFLKWPDFGYGLRPENDVKGWYEWQRTRFPRVRSRYFPSHLRWGKQGTLEWPWMAASDLEVEQMGFKNNKL
ncbi:DNA primase/helicase [Arthrobacter phage Tank]|uniref:Helicase n=1 Tax=Arthrobacter phage Tank TaxID=1772319 RepID=A0A0U4K3K4_9CAUD|nr:DNA primase/helicase [Arthrobacter phage Tank]ALY10604.1 helicase [Arthrobacter phage Tank]